MNRQQPDCSWRTPVPSILIALLVSSGCAPQNNEIDTLRIPVTEPILAIDPFNYVELDLVNNSVYDSLIWYDSETFQSYPQLAKSWRRIDDTTLEFELRDDVTFHDGTKFDADDVVATISWLIDPDSIFPTKQLYRWINRVEKHGPYLVRLVGNEPRAGDLQNLSFPLRIFSAELLNELEDKADYGRYTPVGTGPYKVVQMDRNKGIILERNEDYVLGAPFKRPTIDRIRLDYVPDTFAQIAMLLTGDMHIAKDLAQDQVDMLLERAPHLESTVSPGVIFAHLRIDSINRAGNPALMDRRVRQAILMAINRPSLAENIVPGGRLQDAMCLRVQLACDFSTTVPEYDPEAARRLLREGTVTLDDTQRAEIYARGFDHINENFYMAPLVGIPTLFVHSADVAIDPNPFSLDGAYLYDIAWVGEP